MKITSNRASVEMVEVKKAAFVSVKSDKPSKYAIQISGDTVNIGGRYYDTYYHTDLPYKAVKAAVDEWEKVNGS